MITKLFYKCLHPLRNIAFQALGIKTMGARALVIKNNKTLLIKHTYQKGWYTIGGGVKKNESPHKAILRELFEEVGVTPTEDLQLFSLYHSKKEKRDDYIAFYILHKFDMTKVESPEIEETNWFSLDALPPDITPATTRRIEEYLGHRVISDKW